MSHHWLLITFSWFGPASLQYINTGPAADALIEPLISTLQYPFPYVHYFSQPPELDSLNDAPDNYQDASRKRRTTEEEQTWLPKLIDPEKMPYPNEEVPSSSELKDKNETDVDKRNFSPWGGKRDGSFGHMWTWKRGSAIREPSMPKRVRFSPWGGKRSGQMVYKPGSKASKVIFSTTMPELTRIVSNYSPNGQQLSLTGFQFVPGIDKRHPIKILALSTKVDDRALRDALPFRSFMESLPKIFKPGHPYTDIHLNRDGKRKVKFSAWGGKRSPPIIGPIWTPATQDVKESTLNTILLIRNEQEPKAL